MSVEWRDSYSGGYKPIAHDRQFDEKWSLFLSDAAFEVGEGARTDEENVAHLAAKWADFAHLIAGKDCLDAGCGSGRWTRVMQALGAKSVLSVDMSPASLESVARFNEHTRAADLSSIADQHPDLVGRFDFVNLWGVAHHTHDPRLTVEQVARTVKPGGAMYVMLYNPQGQHGTREASDLRRIFSTLPDDERMEFLDAVVARRWHPRIPLRWNLKNVLRNLRRQPKGNKIGVFDLLSPFYNWTVRSGDAERWLRNAGFSHVDHRTVALTSKAGRHYLARDKA